MQTSTVIIIKSRKVNKATHKPTNDYQNPTTSYKKLTNTGKQNKLPWLRCCSNWLLNLVPNTATLLIHYCDAIMGTEASQITSLTIVYSTVYSDADQNKHQSSASLAFVRGIHRGPVNSPHKGPVTRKMFPFDDVIMLLTRCVFWTKI